MTGSPGNPDGMIVALLISLTAATRLHVMLGAEPAQFGPFRILGEEEDTAFTLLGSLTDAQQQQAVILPPSRGFRHPRRVERRRRRGTRPTTASVAATR